jgi:branched-subunit amino acid transport protein
MEATMNNTYIYIFIAAATSYLIRVLPLTLIRRPIKNRFIRSFLFYVPYVTLAVMTFPAITEATAHPLAGTLALIVGIVITWHGLGLFPVAISCCIVAYVVELVYKCVLGV